MKERVQDILDTLFFCADTCDTPLRHIESYRANLPITIASGVAYGYISSASLTNVIGISTVGIRNSVVLTAGDE